MNDLPHPEIDPAIAHLDLPFCDWRPECDRLAVWRIRFHFPGHCSHVSTCCERHAKLRDDDGNRLIDICGQCFEQLRQETAAHVWKLNHHSNGRACCTDCGAPVRAVNDIIRERTKL